MAEETVRLDLDELLLTLRAAGVRRYRNGGLEIEFHPDYSVAADPVGEAAAEDNELTPEQRHERALGLLLRSSGSAVPARLKIMPPVPKAAE